MAAQNPPYSMQTGAHGAELFRRAVGSVLNTAGGVVALGDLAVTANSPAAMNVLVASGSIWIPGTTNTAQGMYHCFNDASVTLSITAASATNPRIDTIVAQVEDAAYAGATNAWKLAVVTGTATVGATLANLTGAGAVPASSLVLAYVLVAANATTIVAGAVQDNRIFARPNLPMRGNPSGTIYQTTLVNIANGATSQMTMPGSTGILGGMTAGSDCLRVPVTGNYLISWMVTAADTTHAVALRSGVGVGTSTTTAVAYTSGIAHAVSTYMYPSSGGSVMAYLPANNYINLWAYQINSAVASVPTAPGLGFTWLSASLVGI